MKPGRSEQSIDNLVVIAVLVGKLPKERQATARYAGMTVALVPRLVLLIFIGWIIGLTKPMFFIFGQWRFRQGPDPRHRRVVHGWRVTGGGEIVRQPGEVGRRGRQAKRPHRVQSRLGRLDPTERRLPALSSCAATRRLWGSQAA